MFSQRRMEAMANRNEILSKISEYKSAGQDIIRRQYLADLKEYTGNDTIIYASAFAKIIKRALLSSVHVVNDISTAPCVSLVIYSVSVSSVSNLS